MDGYENVFGGVPFFNEENVMDAIEYVQNEPNMPPETTKTVCNALTYVYNKLTNARSEIKFDLDELRAALKYIRAKYILCKEKGDFVGAVRFRYAMEAVLYAGKNGRKREL